MTTKTNNKKILRIGSISLADYESLKDLFQIPRFARDDKSTGGGGEGMGRPYYFPLENNPLNHFPKFAVGLVPSSPMSLP